MILYAVDDEPLALRKIVNILKRLRPNDRIEGFDSAEAFRQAFSQTPADVVFMDAQMPVISGVALARQAQELSPKVNLVFTTGYAEYASDALNMFASGYVLKPVTEEEIARQLEHLRYPEACRMKAITFGRFAFYADGKPVAFHRKKSEELLAFLIDRGGAFVPRSELSYVLFGDERHTRESQNLLNVVLYGLKRDLAAAGAEKILSSNKNGVAVNREALTADLFDYFNGQRQLFQGEYMEQFSWGESFKGIHYGETE